MKAARFSNLVEKCGEPEAYLLLIDPAKDRTFQAAVKAQRVMTVFQEDERLSTHPWRENRRVNQAPLTRNPALF